jgi:hypothetical protein
VHVFVVSLSLISSSLICIFNRMDNFASVKQKSEQMLRSKERRTVVNIFSYMKRLRRDQIVNWITGETAEATGISETSVIKIRSESARGPMVTSSKKGPTKRVGRYSGGKGGR